MKYKNKKTDREISDNINKKKNNIKISKIHIKKALSTI